MINDARADILKYVPLKVICALCFSQTSGLRIFALQNQKNEMATHFNRTGFFFP